MTLTIESNEIDRIARLGPDAFYVFMWQARWRGGDKQFNVTPHFATGNTWTKARLAKALAALTSEGAFIVNSDGLYSWGPTAAQMGDFIDLVMMGAKPSEARKKLVAAGVPDPGAAFWTAQAKAFKADMGELANVIGESTGPDGEIYGFRE